MDLYDKTSYEVSELVMRRYSTSFGASSRLFSLTIRKDIYAIYGLVRIADEIVDSYKGDDASELIVSLQEDVLSALKTGYSANPIVHAFALTARKYKIDASLIVPFFDSMIMDLAPHMYTKKLYETYIYGSAEVIGLMCLKVFCEGNDKHYKQLEKGARALGAAYQKVNFLRDMAADYKELGRVYFPDVVFDTFEDTARDHIIADIEKDFSVAKKALPDLPRNSQRAVRLSVVYYEALLAKLKQTPSAVIKQKRIRISNARKSLLLLTSGRGVTHAS